MSSITPSDPFDPPRSESEDGPWWHRTRWRYALGAFLLGVVYTGCALLLGVSLRFADRDVTLLGGAVVEFSFAVFGYLLGAAVEAQRREQESARRVQRQTEALGILRERLAEQEKLAALGQLAGTVAHEVRNPLAIIRSLTQSLGEDLSAEDGGETCDLILEEIDRLNHVTSTLIGWIRPLELEPGTVEVDRLVQRVHLLMASLLAQRALRLELEPPAEPMPGRIAGDEDLLCQVLLGLLDNAAAVSPSGGRLNLAWRQGKEGLEITVSDQGPGVPEALRERIFEPFFTTREGGTGLGLAVARQIVDAHGGTLHVADQPGGGARFSMCLPLLPPLADLGAESLGSAA